jgi:hypothetical protein
MFLSARLKIDRANQHLRDLESSIANLPNLNRASVEPDPQGRGSSIKHEIPDFGKIKDQLALVTGDCIHNFRTALDHAWVGCIKNIGLIPDHRTKFPVRPDIENLKGVLKGVKIDISRAELFDLMVSDIKAYKTGNEPLWTLHDLDIADKHEVLLVVQSYESINNIRIEDETGYIGTGGTWGGLHKNPIFIDIPNTHKIHYHGDRSMTISLDHGKSIKHIPITVLLQTFSRLTMNIIQLLEKITEP